LSIVFFDRLEYAMNLYFYRLPTETPMNMEIHNSCEWKAHTSTAQAQHSICCPRGCDL